MKIAVFLTGLIIEKTITLLYIKEMFDNFAKRNNLQIDYYCHFWNSENLYPYNIDYHKTKIVVPWENLGSIQYAIDIFNPIQYKISNFVELLPSFKQYYNLISDDSDWVIKNKEYINKEEFNKTLHEKFFVDNYENPDVMFDYWWYYHTEWCRFVHTFSQAYSSIESLKLIKESNQNYDACIKWRFDVLADLTSNNDKLIAAIKHSSDNNSICTEIAWEGLEWKADLSSSIVNNADESMNISLHDGWWITSSSLIDKLIYSLNYNYINDMKDLHSGKHVGQHTHFYKGIKSLNVDINLIGRISSNIIRFTNSIPEDYNNRADYYYNIIYDKNFKFKPKSDYVSSLSYWNKQSQYFTIKYFDFY